MTHGLFDPVVGLRRAARACSLVVAMLLFGSARLPSLMRNLGRSATEFKKGMRDDDADPTTDPSHKD